MLVGMDPLSCAATQEELGQYVQVIQADARELSTAEMAIHCCLEKFKDFDGLYHVAGGSGRRFGDGPLHELSLEGWNQTLELNLTSLMLSNQAAVRKLKALQKPGSILNLGSVLGFHPSPVFFSTHAYAAAKAAIEGFSRSIAAYYSKDGIRVNVILPGLVDTPMAGRAVSNQQIQQYIKGKQPMEGGRIGRPGDLDGLALYFMSELSTFTTGQIVAVDGGWGVSEGLYS